MAGGSRAGVVGTVVAVASLAAGCIAPDIERIGALGVTVDAEQQPVLVIEACAGAAVAVDLSFDREGLAADEENEEAGSWSADAPVPGTSRLVLPAPTDPWHGDAVEVAADRGYVATAVGEGDRDVLSQVAFRGADLAEMEPGTVYTNVADPDDRELVGRSPEEFVADTCDR